MLNDWNEAFAPMVRAILNGRSPYDRPGWNYPPWLFLPLLPVFWVPWWLAMFFPAAILGYGAYRQRKIWIIPIVATSFPFIALSLYANVDWVVLLGLIIRGRVGAILVTTKPQAGAFSILADLKERKSWRDRAWFLLPLAVIALVSTIIFPNWIEAMLGTPTRIPERNASLFPYTIPLGLAALWWCWRKADPIFGVIASLALSPYLYIHSTVPLLFMLADRDWRLGVLGNVVTWGVVLLSLAGVIPIVF
jgi:hypothetical protein